MKEELNHEDAFLKGLFQEHATKPDSDITGKVMQRIEQSSEVFEYKPLISQKAWVMIGSAFVVAISYLIIKSEGIVIETPTLINLIGNGLGDLGNSFQVKWSIPQLPEIPMPLLVSFAAFNIIGVYLMISFKWSRRMFK